MSRVTGWLLAMSALHVAARARQHAAAKPPCICLWRSKLHYQPHLHLHATRSQSPMR
jgi:hypothetical protein